MECGVGTKYYYIQLCLWILHWCSGFLWRCNISLWKLSEVCWPSVSAPHIHVVNIMF